MTGFVGRQTRLADTATVLRDSGVRGVTWGSITWNSDPNDTCTDPGPPGTSIAVRARAADEQEDLSSLEYVPVQKDQALPGLSGRFLEIEVTLAARQCGEEFTSPVLCDLTVRLAGEDCDDNTLADACEVLDGTGDDCNANGVLDSCELPNHDCNGNHLLDECDILEGRSNDCNHNGIPDECDVDSQKGGSSEDVNGNVIPDECEGCAPSVVFDASNFSLQGSVNITTDESGNLQLDPPALLYPFINVACSGRGTVARIFIGSGVFVNGVETVPPRIIGEYRTTPDGIASNPSRTTVDRYGNVWVANRDDTSGGKGSITRIGVIVDKTTHEWVDNSHRYVRNLDGTYTQDDAGQYIKVNEDTDECTCQDRHGATIYDPPDGYIKTSMGGYIDDTDNVLPWRAKDCLPDDIDSVRLAEDECIINVNLRPTPS
jgi:hypothetical protein